MNTQVKALIDAAYAAYNAGQSSDQARLAAQAFNITPTSDPAATLYFLAEWQEGRKDQASDFIKRFVSQNGATIKSLYCVLWAMLQQQDATDVILKSANMWLDGLKPDDIRRRARNDGSEPRILSRSLLGARATEIGKPIVDRFGLIGSVKSMDDDAMRKRWSQASYHGAENISVLTGEWYAYDDERVYLDETLSWPSYHTVPRPYRITASSPTILHVTEDRALLQLPRSTVTIDENCILIGSNPNYYYWLVDNLARFATIDGVYDVTSLKILVGDDISEMHIDALRRLNIPAHNILRFPPHTAIFCKKLIVPAPLLSIDVVHPAGLQWLRQKFGPAHRDPTYPSKIFVSRSKAHRRPFLNETEVFGKLEPLGFVKITPDQLSFEAQNIAFQNADIVVSPFGTCLTPTLFAPTTCAILEIIDEPSIPLHRFMENIAVQLGQPFRCILSQKADSKSMDRSAAYAFTVSPESVFAH